jgi:putative intracellular protease/amidase
VNGQPLVRGRQLTGFSNAEEEAVKRTNDMPFLLEDELKRKGAKYENAPEMWGSWVVVDGNIITGQNPASAKGVAEALAKAIAE